MNIPTILQDAENRMKKAITSLEKEYSKIRTGRASSSLIEDIRVDYYGTPTPIQQLSSITVPDSYSLAIQPWDKGSFSLIEKALQKSDLGLTPVNDGKIIRITLPPLTEERRKELVKVARKYVEETKVAIRNVRRDANESLKKLEKDKSISEDELKKATEDSQKLTDTYVSATETRYHNKEKEIMEL